MRPPPWVHALVSDTQGSISHLKRERSVGAAVPKTQGRGAESTGGHTEGPDGQQGKEAAGMNWAW